MDHPLLLLLLLLAMLLLPLLLLLRPQAALLLLQQLPQPQSLLQQLPLLLLAVTLLLQLLLLPHQANGPLQQLLLLHPHLAASCWMLRHMLELTVTLLPLQLLHLQQVCYNRLWACLALVVVCVQQVVVRCWSCCLMHVQHFGAASCQ